MIILIILYCLAGFGSMMSAYEYAKDHLDIDKSGRIITDDIPLWLWLLVWFLFWPTFLVAALTSDS